jgi:hypothetical protein
MLFDCRDDWLCRRQYYLISGNTGVSMFCREYIAQPSAFQWPGKIGPRIRLLGMVGWVYIITNESMPGLVKVGYSSKHPEYRAAELNKQ